MSQHEPLRTRWRDTADVDSEPAARLFQRLARPELGPEQLTRVRSRIESTLAQSPAPGPLQALRRGAVARRLLALLCIGGVLLLGFLLRPRVQKEPSLRPAPVPQELPRVAVEPIPLPQAPLPIPPDPAPAPTVNERLEAPEVRPLRPVPRRVHVVRDTANIAPPATIRPQPEVSPPTAEPPAAVSPVPTPTPAPPPEPSLAEFQLLSEAVQQLRREHAPAAALRILDTYDSQFPRGELRPEAVWLRVQALVQLGQRREALKILDAQPLSAEGERGEPLVLRGQLRSEAGRCPEAIPDFDAAAILSSGELLERTFLHRGLCRVRTGDVPGARADFSVYLVRFPTGRYTDTIRKALRELPQPAQ